MTTQKKKPTRPSGRGISTQHSSARMGLFLTIGKYSARAHLLRMRWWFSLSGLRILVGWDISRPERGRWKAALSLGQGEEDENQENEGKGQNLMRYAAYHAACVVTHLFVEDEEALDGVGLLHMFLDGCGNVVRQWQIDDEGGITIFDGTREDSVWKEEDCARSGELGPAYRTGGVRGPPYSVLRQS
ncbi:uncharacterized protein BDW70DRAFT_14346 [Aspergillus foveolatus]|uniref:uncharacterized protein n=1 Tax=Aspergillus foveolatus TaxID=210207 RepID=UPI003CCE0EFC